MALLQDILAFFEQLIPSPINWIWPYRFSAVDLAVVGRNERLAAPGAIAASTRTLATFDVLSYNVNNVAARSQVRRRRILRAIFSSGADVILLQETNAAWEGLLREDAAALQFRYNHFHHPGSNDRPAGGVAVLSQYPLENVQLLDFSNDVPGSVFPALIFEVKIPMDGALGNGGSYVTISMANVHFRPPVELDGSAWLDTARKTSPIRLKEAKELVQRTASIKGMPATTTTKLPLDIIAGDFNEGDDMPALDYLTGLGFRDALQQHVPRRKKTHTWPFMRNFLLRKRLDHVLWHEGPLTAALDTNSNVKYDVNLHCLACGVMTGYEYDASDHQPILSRFAVVLRQ